MSSDKAKAVQKKVVYVVNRSVSPMALLAVLFVALRIAGVIAWPWYWLVAPLWLPIAIAWGFVAGTLCIVGVIGILAGIVALWLDRKK